jgi:hypothetical protein
MAARERLVVEIRTGSARDAGGRVDHEIPIKTSQINQRDEGPSPKVGTIVKAGRSLIIYFYETLFKLTSLTGLTQLCSFQRASANLLSQEEDVRRSDRSICIEANLQFTHT